MPLIRKEKIAKPRILLIDFDPKVVQSIQDQGYLVFHGESGLSGNTFQITQHPSEFELIFWDCSKLQVGTDGSPREWDAITKLVPYFIYVRKHNGICTLLLSRDVHIPEFVFRATGYTLRLHPRQTTNIIPPEYTADGKGIQDLLRPLFERFIQDKNVTFSIEWTDNKVGYDDFFTDEDNKSFVGYDDNGLLIFPFVDHQADFIMSALQDCFPNLTDDTIFPDLHNIVWLNGTQFQYPGITSLEEKIGDIRKKAQEEESKLKEQIATIESKTAFLNKALISDDSDAFIEEDKLKPQVVKMFDALGFKVKDLDKENEQLGQALKEDIQIRDDDDFFALVEVKGTERGAKASWVRTDLNAHITEYARLKKVTLDSFSSMIVFNHERRIKPDDRTKPFASDPQLVEYCEKSSITLVPIYELYKVCVAVMTGKIEATEARALIKKPGLFSFK